MTNLADLLPAGGGQNNTEFVADGNVSAGAPVILTAAGKAAPIAQSPVSASITAQGTFNTLNTNVYIDSCYDSNNDKLVIVYVAVHPSGHNALYAIVGTIASDGSISYGTAELVYSDASYQVTSCAACFDSTNNKVIAAYTRNWDNSGRALVGTVSGTSISFGSETIFESGDVNSSMRMAFDSGNGKTVICYRDNGDSNKPKAIVGTTSGTSISFGSATTIQMTAIQPTGGIGFDSNLGKIVFAYRDTNNSYYGTCAVGTVSGTSISFGTQVVWESVNVQAIAPKIPFDSTNNKLVFVYAYSDNDGYAIVGTVSGTSISFGSNAEFENANIDYGAAAYNPDSEKVDIFYMDQGNSNYGTYVLGTVSGTSISFNTPAVFRSAQCQFNATTFTIEGRTANSYADIGTSSYGSNLIYQGAYDATNLTSTNFLGLAPEAISDTETGTINTWGSRCESSSILADSLSLASADTTSGNTTKENVSIAYDSNADRTILVYRDGNDSDKLKCIIGTLSGTSTSWGTAVEIVGATAGNRGTAVVYDSNAQRVLIAYTKADTYVYVRVGEISGTSVTLGTEVAASSSNSYYPELSYDVADQKVLLVFANAGDNYYPYSAACTITAVGNSVAVTTPASVASRNAYDPFGLAYNANDGKHVLDITDNTSTGYAYVLTMSSGSISVGAEASYSPGFTPRQSFCVYDSSAQKIVRGYYSNTDPRPVEFAVASISGTSVSFGTAATCFAGNGGRQVSGTFYSSINQTAFFNLDFATTSVQTNFGTVSGTTITFGTATAVASSGISSTSYFDITYDSTAQKLIYAYRATTFDAVVGSFGTTPLTVTSDYYVQGDGTISTTSTSPAQLIGNAIKTNQINIKDYTG